MLGKTEKKKFFLHQVGLEFPKRRVASGPLSWGTSRKPREEGSAGEETDRLVRVDSGEDPCEGLPDSVPREVSSLRGGWVPHHKRTKLYWGCLTPWHQHIFITQIKITPISCLWVSQSRKPVTTWRSLPKKHNLEYTSLASYCHKRIWLSLQSPKAH